MIEVLGKRGNACVLKDLGNQGFCWSLRLVLWMIRWSLGMLGGFRKWHEPQQGGWQRIVLTDESGRWIISWVLTQRAGGATEAFGFLRQPGRVLWRQCPRFYDWNVSL